VDGTEGKTYDGVGDPLFSPDSQRVAYVVQTGIGTFVVLDGEEGKRYEAIVTTIRITSNRETRVIFDSGDSFHYLAALGNKIYLVEEKIK